MEHYGFFNGDQEYGQEEFSRYFDNIFESGINFDLEDNLKFKVSNEGNVIKIGDGFAIVKGFYLFNDSIKNIKIVANPNYDRVDRVVIRLNLSTKVVSINLKEGVAGSHPVTPAIQRDNLIYELSLAQVKITNSGIITIIDERFRTELCGGIRPKNQTEYKDMIKQFQSQFDSWFNQQQALGWRKVYIQPNEPEGSVPGSIWIQTY